MNDLNYKMGNRIADARKRKKLTQEVLAEKLDLSVKHISAVERGKSSLSLPKLVELCEILDVSLDYLVTGTNFIQTDKPLPKSMLNVFLSEDSSEIDLFLEYISLFEKLRKQ